MKLINPTPPVGAMLWALHGGENAPVFTNSFEFVFQNVERFDERAENLTLKELELLDKIETQSTPVKDLAQALLEKAEEGAENEAEAHFLMRVLYYSVTEQLCRTARKALTLYEIYKKDCESFGLDFSEKQFVYAMYSPTTKLTKIGRTTNVGDRVKQLNTAAAHLGIELNIKMLLNVKTKAKQTSSFERYLHEYFAEFRVKGEWFSLNFPLAELQSRIDRAYEAFLDESPALPAELDFNFGNGGFEFGDYYETLLRSDWKTVNEQGVICHSALDLLLNQCDTLCEKITKVRRENQFRLN